MKINSVITAINIRKSVPAIIYDVLALAFIYLIPTFSHLLNFPLYYIEPMRLMIIIAIAHTHRNNAYALAVTLPLFSFLVAAHPIFVKSLLISIELLFMVWLFSWLSQRFNNFASILTSILASKILYYGMKFGAIIAIMPKEALVSIPLYMQLINTVFFSALLFAMLRYKK